MKRKYVIILSIILLLLIASLTTGVSFAFFNASVIGNDVASNNVITTGNMEITYNDGSTIGSNDNLIPGNSIEKSFSIKNTGDIVAYYSIYLNDVVNTFVTKEDLVCKLTREDNSVVFDDTCPSLNVSVASNISIGINEIHNYILKITFLLVDRNQDDNKGKGFNARVDLVEEENKTKYIADQIIDFEKVNTGDLMYDGVDTLGEFGTDDNNLRYIGANPSNYIYFNCSTTNPIEMNDSTCEKWRIIGVFNNVEDRYGNAESRVKLIRAQSIGGYSWDSSDDSSNSGVGINQWGESVYQDGTFYEGADIMRELNTDYLGNITVGVDGYWYNGSNNHRGQGKPSKLLNSNSVEMIQEVKWHLGGGIGLDNAKKYYEAERSNDTSLFCDDEKYCNDTVIRNPIWIGKVGILQASDNVYAVGNSSSLVGTSCEKFFSGGDICRKNENWLYLGNELTMNYNTNRFDVVCYVSAWDGGVGWVTAHAPWLNIRPSLFLKSNVKIVGGSGTSESPYKLGI